MDREPVSWITVNGQHVPLFAGESKADAVKRVAENTKKQTAKDANDKEKQISQHKSEADKLNNQDSNKATVFTQQEHEKAIAELNSSKYSDGTYDIRTKTIKEFNSGYQVTFCQIGDKYTPEQYADKVNECLKLSSDGKTYAGKFESTPEISFHCNSREQAIAYAKANNQISIWDWEKCDEIKTGGTGRRN